MSTQGEDKTWNSDEFFHRRWNSMGPFSWESPWILSYAQILGAIWKFCPETVPLPMEFWFDKFAMTYKGIDGIYSFSSTLPNFS